MKFNDIRFKPQIQKNLKAMGFDELMDVQEKTILPILEGKDIVGQAETGSGKTLAFALPIIEKIHPGAGIQALVLTPTRELAMQISDVFRDIGKDLKINVTTVYGGVSIDMQIKMLRTTDIVVGTPGRMLDHIERRTIDFGKVRFLVLDETDRMFDMGFIEDVEKIINCVPQKRQTLLFSATMYGILDHIIQKHLKNPLKVRTQTHVHKTKLRQVFYDIYNQNEKFSLLVHLLKHSTSGLALVFVATRRETDVVTKNLQKNGLNAMTIHGGMTQSAREKSLDALKNEKTDILVATDVAARGLDIKNVTHVYNYDVPKTSKEYIHRIGRTARAGEKGKAVTLLVKRDHDNFRRVSQDDQLDIVKEEMPEFDKIYFDRFIEEKRRRFGSRPDNRKRGTRRVPRTSRRPVNRH